MNMSPWFINPPWQNFSSSYREAITAREAKTGMERAHHLTASLYFAIAALEAFLNQKMRAHLEATRSEEEIFSTLRKTKTRLKIKKWPEDLLRKPLGINKATLSLIALFNDVRDNLTHPKTHGRDIYSKLEAIDPISVIDPIAEYIVRFHQAEGTRFPYWLFGWNFLNPRPNSYEIVVVNNQQFCCSVQALGFHVAPGSQDWQDHHLGTFEGYVALKQLLGSLNHCEPKSPFPYQPILCRRWWIPEHQRSCGHVTGEALAYAREHGT